MYLSSYLFSFYGFIDPLPRLAGQPTTLFLAGTQEKRLVRLGNAIKYMSLNGFRNGKEAMPSALLP
jgi:hypothetical protein